MKFQAKLALFVGTILSLSFSVFAQEMNICESYVIKNKDDAVINLGIRKYLNESQPQSCMIGKKAAQIEALNHQEFLPYLHESEVAQNFVFPGQETVTQKTYSMANNPWIVVEFKEVIPGLQFTFELQKNTCRCRTSTVNKNIQLKCQIKDSEGNLVLDKSK
jgi:hypothetical protein